MAKIFPNLNEKNQPTIEHKLEFFKKKCTIGTSLCKRKGETLENSTYDSEKSDSSLLILNNGN